MTSEAKKEKDILEITKGENANLAGIEPRCSKCESKSLSLNFEKPITPQDDRDEVGPYVVCGGCGAKTFAESWMLADFAQFFRSPAPTPPLDVEGWKRPEDSLPDEDSDVLAAIWWEDAANPEQSSYGIHDCAYYEGGEGSAQKIFTDCEGEEFEAKEVAFWIYKKDLAASLLRRHIASPAPQGFRLPDELMDGAVKVVRPTDLRNRVGMYMMEERGIKMGRNVDPGDVQDMIVEFVQRELTKGLELAASPAQPEKRDEWVSVDERLPEIYQTVIFCIDSEEDSQEIQAIVRKNFLGAVNNADYEDIKVRGYTHWRDLEVQPLPAPPQSGKEGQ